MQDEIDYPKEYDNSGRVENSKELLDKFMSDSAAFRENQDMIADLDQTYGPKLRNMMDIFWPGDEAGQQKKSPIVMFIHGGYWQILDRSAFSHLATGLNARGIAVAMPSYTLCPDITIEGIINEIRRACLVLYQTYRKKITVVGHSAGGHLAACMMATDWQGIHSELPEDLVASGLGISGLYDLLPITKTPVNDAVGMNENEAHAASPIHWMPEALQRFEAWVGADESNEYHRQSRELANFWTMCGTPTAYVSVEGANHFTVVDELVSPSSPMVKCILDLVNQPATDIELVEPDEAELTANMILSENSEPKEKTEKRPPKTVAKGQRRKPKPRSGPKNKEKKGEKTNNKLRMTASVGGKVPLKAQPGSTKKQPKKQNQRNEDKTTAQ